MSFRKLEVWQLSRELTINIHKMTLTQLPSFEKFEVGSQIRRSIKSVKSTIVEGYGRRRYKQEFIRYLTYALASCDETMDHLETLSVTGSLNNCEMYQNLHCNLEILGKKLNLFLQAVCKNHLSEK